MESRGRLSPRRGESNSPPEPELLGVVTSDGPPQSVQVRNKNQATGRRKSALLRLQGHNFVAGAIRVLCISSTKAALMTGYSRPVPSRLTGRFRLLPIGFPDYIFGLLVLPDPNETAVTQVVVRSPLHEFELPHEHRL